MFTVVTLKIDVTNSLLENHLVSATSRLTPKRLTFNV